MSLDPEDKSELWFFGLLIICGILFGGTPDLVDRIGMAISKECVPGVEK